MKYKKRDMKRDTIRFSINIAAVIIIVGAVLSFSMYTVIQKSFFKVTAEHEMQLMSIMETIGSQLIDFKLNGLKQETEYIAGEYGEILLNGTEDSRKTTLASIEMKEHQLNYSFMTSEELFSVSQLYGNYIESLNLSEVWDGNTKLFSPDFDDNGNYIMAVAAPVWKNKQKHEVGGILIEQVNGYCMSKWLGDLFLSLNLGTAYMIDSSGRNIATADSANYDWITTRYNAQELAKTDKSESTQSVARLEGYALQGRTGIDTYIWEGSTNYVAYGPLKEADWGFFIGFYGDKFGEYTQKITNISSFVAGLMIAAFALFLGTIMTVIMRNLNHERSYNEMLIQQKTEIEQQALSIIASEERFRIAMQRSRDIILEYQLETGEITCFYEGKEMKSGIVGDEKLRKRILGECHMDEESFIRFEEVMRAISKGLTSVECMVSGEYSGIRKWYKLSVSSIPNNPGMPTRAVGILRDITGEREAELDSLTRLLNKAAITERVKAVVKKNIPETKSAFVMLDVDNFKQVNDKYGHLTGDKVLCAVADNLREIFTEPYITGRFGGDEFCIYCSEEAELHVLKGKLEELLEKVRSIQINDCTCMNISLSIGAVIFCGPAQFEKIYTKADEMLYYVKESGRGSLRIFEVK